MASNDPAEGAAPIMCRGPMGGRREGVALPSSPLGRIAEEGETPGGLSISAETAHIFLTGKVEKE